MHNSWLLLLLLLSLCVCERERLRDSELLSNVCFTGMTVMLSQNSPALDLRQGAQLVAAVCVSVLFVCVCERERERERERVSE